MPIPTPDEIIFQELASFAVLHGLNVGVRDLRVHAVRVYDRLNSVLLSHPEAATMLGVHPDTLHTYRKQGAIDAIAKNPGSLRTRWLYRLADLLELQRIRPTTLQASGGR